MRKLVRFDQLVQRLDNVVVRNELSERRWTIFLDPRQILKVLSLLGLCFRL